MHDMEIDFRIPPFAAQRAGAPVCLLRGEKAGHPAPDEAGQVVPATWGKVLENFGDWVTDEPCRNEHQ